MSNPRMPNYQSGNDITVKTQIVELFNDKGIVNAKDIIKNTQFPKGVDNKTIIAEVKRILLELIREQVIDKHPTKKGHYVDIHTVQEQLGWVQVAFQKYPRLSANIICREWEKFDTEDCPPVPDPELILHIMDVLLEDGQLFIHPANAHQKGIKRTDIMYGSHDLINVYNSHQGKGTSGNPMLSGGSGQPMPDEYKLLSPQEQSQYIQPVHPPHPNQRRR